MKESGKNKRFNFIGMRVLKTVIAVYICLLISGFYSNKHSFIVNKKRLGDI